MIENIYYSEYVNKKIVIIYIFFFLFNLNLMIMVIYISYSFFLYKKNVVKYNYKLGKFIFILFLIRNWF